MTNILLMTDIMLSAAVLFRCHTTIKLSEFSYDFYVGLGNI